MTVPLVRGNAMISAHVMGLTPQFITPRKVVSVKIANGTEIYPSGTGQASDVRFDITLDDGRVWVVFLGVAVEFKAGANFLRATVPVLGTSVRLALAG